MPSDWTHRTRGCWPVSITTLVCRTFERANSRLPDFLENTSHISPSQHGFRQNRGCETALATVSHYISNNMDNRVAMDLMQLDLVNAFDALNLTEAEIPWCRHKRPLCWCGCVADSSRCMGASALMSLRSSQAYLRAWFLDRPCSL